MLETAEILVWFHDYWWYCLCTPIIIVALLHDPITNVGQHLHENHMASLLSAYFQKQGYLQRRDACSLNDHGYSSRALSNVYQHEPTQRCIWSFAVDAQILKEGGCALSLHLPCNGRVGSRIPTGPTFSQAVAKQGEHRILST